MFAVGRRMEKLLETKNLAKTPEDVVLVQADVASEAGRAKVQEAVGDKVLKYLIQNAGVVGPLKPLKDTELEEFQKVMATNVEVSSCSD